MIINEYLHFWANIVIRMIVSGKIIVSRDSG